MIFLLLQFGLFLCVYIISVQSFAMNLIHEQCNRPMEEGVIMMGKPVQYKPSYHLEVISSNGLLVNNQSHIYIDNNVDILVSLQPKITQMVLEIRSSEGNVTFHDGFCNSKRTIRNRSKIVFDGLTSSSGSASAVRVELRAVWAETYSEGVRITDPFHFFIKKSNIHDTL